MFSSAEKTIPSLRSAGFTMMELTIAVAIFLLALIPLGKLVGESNRAFRSLAGRAQIATRGQLVMTRLVEDLSAGRFASLVPAVPENSTSIQFRPITGFSGGSATFGDVTHIELVPLESQADDGLDDDGDGLVDEAGLRIWSDKAPFGATPGAEDKPIMLAENLAANGLTFTREGAVLRVQLTLQARSDPGQPLTLVTLESAARMRNE